MRNYQILCTIGHHGKQTTGKNQIIDDWIRETKDYPRFPLVEQTQPVRATADDLVEI